MRFLCPKCKAKYQIADEKLEGRAVRMKCRKCGDVIDVPSPAKPVVPTSGEAPAKAQPPPSSTPEPARVGSLPSISRPLPPSPPRSPAVRPVPPSGAPRPPMASGARLSAPSRPDIARPSPALRPVPPRATPAAPPVKTPSEPPSAGGLADAFSLRVREPQPSDVSAAIEVLSAGAGEEWYVGINGVPLGPVRLSTLRQKAQQGAINEESLVWRAGFEEWLPLRTFPELLLLVREAKEGGGRVSYLPPPPQPRRISQPPPAPVAHAAPPPAEPEQEPATVIAPSADAIALMGQVTADPFAAPKPLAPSIVVAPAEDDSGRRSIVDDIAVGVRKQVRMHPAAYVLIAIAFGFGATGAIVFFSNDRGPAPPPTIQVVTVTAPAVVPTGTDPAGAVSVAMNTEDPPPEVRAGTAARPASTDNKPANGSDPPKTDEKGVAPRVGLGASPAIDGPSVGGPSPGSGGNLPQQLDQSDIERVVNAHRASVKRGCWEPALAVRDPKAPKSAKVTVSIGIAASGNVSSASASGGDGFPGLAGCVAGRVRGWKFPPSGGPSQASVPFAFFSQ